VSLLDLVLEARFDANNARHRRKLDEDDSLLDAHWPAGVEFVEVMYGPGVDDRMAELCRRQLRYRHSHGWRLWEARWFERGVRGETVSG
jgi:hypothetical protein